MTNVSITTKASHEVFGPKEKVKAKAKRVTKIEVAQQAAGPKEVKDPKAVEAKVVKAKAKVKAKEPKAVASLAKRTVSPKVVAGEDVLALLLSHVNHQRRRLRVVTGQGPAQLRQT